MKLSLSLILILAAGMVHAETIGPGCRIAWDYATADEQRIDGFRIYKGAIVAGTASPDARETSCADAGVVIGLNTLSATAYNAAGESLHSDPVTFVFVDTAPAGPGNVRIVVSIP